MKSNRGKIQEICKGEAIIKRALQPGDIFSNFHCVPKPSWGHPEELKGHLARSVKSTLGMIWIPSTVSLVGLKPFRHIWSIAGLWDVGGEGGGEGELGRNGREPIRPGETIPIWSE